MTMEQFAIMAFGLPASAGGAVFWFLDNTQRFSANTNLVMLTVLALSVCAVIYSLIRWEWL